MKWCLLAEGNSGEKKIKHGFVMTLGVI